MKHLYKSYDEAIEIFKSYEKKYPDFIKIETIGQTWEKRDIVLLTLSNSVESSDKKSALFYTGVAHAREWIGLELSIAFVSHVIEKISYDPTITEIFENAAIYIVPCMNPDGLEYSRKHFSFWRKNRRQNADGSYGVDLNRNFSIGFKQNNDPKSNIYPGPHPFSEPETQAIKDFVDSHPNITIALDYHSQGNVFFPAHNFKHEDTIDTTDMNTLCANMAEEIRKVSGREYGIHQGKPPAMLISGSGREYYYSKGIISSVVEVGTRNISDYLEDMAEHTSENIPALLAAMREVPNYCKNGLKRVQEFQIDFANEREVSLKWEYEDEEEIYFELYRSTKYKDHCGINNLIGITKSKVFTDKHLKSATKYFYKIRAVKKTLKSPFAPVLKVRTKNARDEFSKELFSVQNKTGYLSRKSTINNTHFGVNSLFVGISDQKDKCISLLTFPLETMPKNAIIQFAKVLLYPINRVSATIEKYGEWNVGILDSSTIDDIYDFNSVNNATVLQYVGRPTKSQHLSQGIWREWKFSNLECSILQKQLQKGEVMFRIDGPDALKGDRSSQMMQWDIGYGKFGYGLSFRPQLQIKYTVPDVRVELVPYQIATISKKDTEPNTLQCGYDKNGKKVYGYIEFDFSSLPSIDRTVVIESFINLVSKNINIKYDIRVHIEFIDDRTKIDYDSIKQREVIEKIGYEKSTDDFKNKSEQSFFFDSSAIDSLEEFWQKNKIAAFVIKPTTSNKFLKNCLVDFDAGPNAPKLTINYISKNRTLPEKVRNFSFKKENNVIKLTWENPKTDDFVGVVVIKNPFRVPKTSYDGQKLYGGSDNYTFDSFGALDESKYFAIFSYDNVPNYSEPEFIKYEAQK